MTEQRGEAAMPSMEYLRDAMRRLHEAELIIDKIRAMHSRNQFGECNACADSRNGSYPCPTRQLVDGDDQSDHWDGTTPLGGDSMDGK